MVQLLPEHDTWDGEENPEDYRYLKKVLDSLKEKYRTVVELRYFEQYSFQEIASSLGVSEGNAKVIHGRAMQKLKQKLEIYG